MRVDLALLPVAALLSLAVLSWALVCIIRAIDFCLCIKRNHGPPRLSSFNGPWAARIGLGLIIFWWAVMELVRMIAPIFEAQEKRFLCKLCILSSMGFTEPASLLVIALLLTASISESPGALAPHWNGRTLRRVIVFCCPLFVTQFGVLFLGENLLPLGFWRVEALLSPQEGIVSCGYPLVNTTLMGLYEVGLVVHVFFRGMALVSLTMNKGLKRRVRVVVFLVVGCVPTRAVLLGASVLLSPAGSMFHCVIFLALLMFLCCASGGLWVLVYCPVVDSLAVERLPRQLFELKN